MPYIDIDSRKLVEQFGPLDAGDLNYSITKLVCSYLLNKPRSNYCALNEVIGVLDCVKFELYDRIVRPYEYMKQIKNGDVYDEVQDRFIPKAIVKDSHG